jgi:hypothetical protein
VRGRGRTAGGSLQSWSYMDESSWFVEAIASHSARVGLRAWKTLLARHTLRIGGGKPLTSLVHPYYRPFIGAKPPYPCRTYFDQDIFRTTPLTYKSKSISKM